MATRPKAPEPGGAPEYVCGRATLAYVLGLKNLDSVGKLVARGMPKMKKHGAYDLAECARWYVQDLHQRGSVSAEEVEEVVKARTRLYEAQTRHKELDTERLAGELVEFQDSKGHMETLVTELTAGLDQLPGRAADAVVRAQTIPDAMEVLREHAGEIRNRLADRFEQVARGLESMRAAGPAPT